MSGTTIRFYLKGGESAMGELTTPDSGLVLGASEPVLMTRSALHGRGGIGFPGYAHRQDRSGVRV